MATVGPANPFGGSVPGVGTLGVQPSGPTLYQFLLALFVLYLVMRYVPNGHIVGAAILAGAILSTPDAVSGFTNLLTFIQQPYGA